MDPIALIVTALAAGAGAGVKDTASSAVKDAYEGLKAMVKGRFSGRPDAELILASHATAPETWERPLAAQLAATGVDAELVAAAQTLMELTDAAGARAGKYAVDNRSSQGVQVGDYNVQHNTFVIGSDGIASATLAKLTDTPTTQRAEITGVPRTEVELQQVLLSRPLGWEYLYFAGQLLHERNNIEAKYRDHEIRYASANGEVVGSTDLAGYIDVVRYISRRASDSAGLVNKLAMLVTDKVAQQRAFGRSFEAGDPDRLAHLAKRWNSVYEEFLDWAASMRGISVPPEFRSLLQLAARFIDGPVEQYRLFVDNYVAQVDALPAAIAAGNELRLEAHLVISIPDEVMQAYYAELARLENQLKQ
jgi:hypothetical protein